MRRSNTSLLTFARAILAVALLSAALLGSPAPARAHGTMVVPESRIHRCAFDGNIENQTDPACRAAIDAGGKQPFYDWNGVRQGDAGGRQQGFIPDGHLCSGGNPTFFGLDLARTDWRTRPIAPDANGRFEFVWHATAPHATRDWSLFLTRDGWDPTQPLRWDEVEPFCSAGSIPLSIDGEGRQVYRIPCDLPRRSGRHVVFAIWQRSDSPEAFYSCSDVEFTGGVDQGWRQIGALRAATRLQVGSVVSLRVFDESGGDLERFDVTLAPGQTGKRLWPFALAQKVNALSAHVRIGVLSPAGEVSPTKTLNGNLVYAAAGRALTFTVDIAAPGTGDGAPAYPDGIGSYAPGTVVRGSDGQRYRCRPFPNSGWCNQAPAYYAPGSGSNWQDAWTKL